MYHPKNREKHSEYMKEWYLEHHEEHNVRSRKIYLEHHRAAMVRSAKSRATKRSLPFTISVDDIVIPPTCPALGIPLEVNEGHNGPKDTSPSLDRVLPTLGYVPGNVAVISNRANRIKSDATPSELRQVADWLETTINRMSPS